jgi:hypothetical protein
VNAQHVLAHIAAYRELEPAERSVVDQHVASCQACAQALAQAQQVDALLVSLPRLRPTAAQDQLLRQRLTDVSRRPPWPGGLRMPARQPQWARLVALVVLVILLSTTGVVAAQSLPDTPFYPLKLAAEQARSLVTFDPTAQAEWQLSLAHTRLHEVTALVAEGRIPSADTLNRLHWQFDRVVTAAAQAPVEETYRLLSAANELNGLAVLRLDDWLRTLPPSVQPVLAQTLADVRDTQQLVQDGLANPENFRLPEVPAQPTTTPTSTRTPSPTATHTPLPSATPTPVATNTPEPPPTWEATATGVPEDTPVPPATPTAEPTATPTRLLPRPTSTASVQPVWSPTPRPTRTRRFWPTPTAVTTPAATIEPLPTREPLVTRTPRPWPTPVVTATPGATVQPDVTPIVTPPRRTPRSIPPRRR